MPRFTIDTIFGAYHSSRLSNQKYSHGHLSFWSIESRDWQNQFVKGRMKKKKKKENNNNSMYINLNELFFFKFFFLYKKHKDRNFLPRMRRKEGLLNFFFCNY